MNAGSTSKALKLKIKYFYPVSISLIIILSFSIVSVVWANEDKMVKMDPEISCDRVGSLSEGGGNATVWTEWTPRLRASNRPRTTDQAKDGACSRSRDLEGKGVGSKQRPRIGSDGYLSSSSHCCPGEGGAGASRVHGTVLWHIQGPIEVVHVHQWIQILRLCWAQHMGLYPIGLA